MTHQLSSPALPFFEGRPCPWVPPDPSQRWGHPKNSHYYSFQSFWILMYGLKNAAQAFQRLMDVVCKDLPFVFVYLDDILIASSSGEEHCTHLRTLFQRLANNGLLLNPNKCEFWLHRNWFSRLPHLAWWDQTQPNQSHGNPQLSRPANKKELQQFAGMMNFYHRCVPHLAELMKPIYAAMSNASKTLLWTTELQNAFCNSKTALANATLLHHPRDQAPTALTTDASDTAIGAVLETGISRNMATNRVRYRNSYMDTQWFGSSQTSRRSGFRPRSHSGHWFQPPTRTSAVWPTLVPLVWHILQSSTTLPTPSLASANLWQTTLAVTSLHSGHAPHSV